MGRNDTLPTFLPSIFDLMREGLVELNLQRRRQDIIICHLGSPQNRWRRLQLGRDEIMDRGRIHQTLGSCHKPTASVEKTNEIKYMEQSLHRLLIPESSGLPYFSSGFWRFEVSAACNSSEYLLEMTELWEFFIIVIWLQVLQPSRRNLQAVPQLDLLEATV